MIRIDEIYNNTIWPWIKKYHPGVRMFFCEPFGRTDPDSLVNYGSDTVREHNYTLLWDQEPIHLNVHIPTFDSLLEKNIDLHQRYNLINKKNQRAIEDGCLKPLRHNYQIGSIITSEQNSDTVEIVCKQFGWKSYYYFFHGWAAKYLDQVRPS